MIEKRPVLKLKYSTFEKVIEVFALVSLISLPLLTYIYWPTIPDRIVTHFGISGNPDSYGGKGSLIIIPIISIFLYLLLSLISKFPHSFNYPVDITEENAGFQYSNARALMLCIKAEIMCTFAYLQWRSIFVSLGKTNKLGIIFFPVFLVMIFGTIIYFTKKSSKHK